MAELATNLNQAPIDTGLHCLMMIAKYNGIRIDPEQVRHTFAVDAEGMTTLDILRAAKDLGMKAKEAIVPFQRLSKLRLPAIVQLTDGTYTILAKIEGQQVLLFNPIQGKPLSIHQEEFTRQWTGSIILFVQKANEQTEQKFGLKWFFPVMWKYKKALSEVLLASLLLQILGILSPIMTQVIIDKVLVHQSLSTLNVLAFAMVMIILTEAILGISRTYVFTHTTSKLDVILGARLFQHLVKLPLRYFEVRRIGDTIARVKELENIRRFITGTPLTSVLDVMFIVVYIAVMFLYSSTLTWVILGTLPLFVLLSAIVTPLLRNRLKEKFNRGAESQAYLVETVSGMQTVKSFSLEPRIQKKWEDLLARYIKSNFSTALLSGTAGSIGQVIQRGSYLVILYTGAQLVMDGSLTVGQLIAFQIFASRVSEPVLRLVHIWQDFQQTAVSLERLGDIFHTKPELTLSAKVRLPGIKGHVRFDHVTFRYNPDGPEIIRNMTFDIAPGMMVGIVGRSGSGKSTISKLLQRLYVAESGKILVDGVDISTADPAWLRRQIGVVLQESFLFNATIRENISIHTPSASMEDIVKAAELAGAHQFIIELPNGYDTMVGEHGIGLSGGQRQRIAIARALLLNPKILIFDEATSALDYESERIIHQNLHRICQGRTVFIISHRLSILRGAHRIMVIDSGKLVEQGTHADLLTRKGLYHYLYTQQEGGI